MEKAYLMMENGQVLEGVSFGASSTVIGELVFTTGMIGCVESLTDPSYYGQIVTYTFPMFGNYGICTKDAESLRCQMKGVVVREFCETPSNFRCEMTAEAFLKEQGVVGIAGLDTRMLTQTLRDKGVMNAAITTDPNSVSLEDIRNFRMKGAVEAAGGQETTVVPPEGDVKFSVALLDYGVTKQVIAELGKLGCAVTVYPYNTPAETILKGGHNGVVLSNGPGDPADNPERVGEVKVLFGKLPMFGIGLGHQLMALAAGGKTVKLKFGHRGANQPVKDLRTGKVSITSQNHGYAVDASSLSGTEGILRCVNVNDNSCEGVDYPRYRAFSLQFHPDTHAGPLKKENAFDQFAAMMKEGL